MVAWVLSWSHEWVPLPYSPLLHPGQPGCACDLNCPNWSEARLWVQPWVQARVQLQFSTPVLLPPYVVLRALVPYYKRRVPPALKVAMGSSTITVRLEGSPAGSQVDVARFRRSYAAADLAAEQRLQIAANGSRSLTVTEQLGVAGHWVLKTQDTHHRDPVDRQEVGCTFQALTDLGLVLTTPIPPDWSCPVQTPSVRTIALRLASQLSGLDHQGLAADQAPPEFLHDPESVDDTDAAAYITTTVRALAVEITGWIAKAKAELSRLGVAVGADQAQQVAARLAAASVVAADYEQQVIAGQHPPAPLAAIFPAPPTPNAGPETLERALAVWQSLRSPAPKTFIDAQRRLAELAASAGTEQLSNLTGEHITAWRTQLLEVHTASTVARKLALVRAVLTVAASDGLPVDAGVIDRLQGRGLGSRIHSGGTTQQRQPFSAAQAKLLITTSRRISSPRALDRWGFPLGLATGARLEELAGLRPDDICQVDSIWVAVIQPHESRRLKNDSSSRSVPIPAALIKEGFIAWAQQQTGELLFPEPTPPAADPRLSHYASKRLGDILRKQAGITDKALVFHSTRHFAAQALTDAGIDDRTIGAITGHANRSMISRYSRAGIPVRLLADAQNKRDWSWWPTPETP